MRIIQYIIMSDGIFNEIDYTGGSDEVRIKYNQKKLITDLYDI